MSKKLWGGRFSKSTHPFVDKFTTSIDYDKKLAKYDVWGSVIHVDILERSGYLLPEEAEKLNRAFDKIINQIGEDTFEIDPQCEDIHTCIQNKLENFEDIGDLVLKLHTARSRNDQVLFDLKLFCKFELRWVRTLCEKLQKALNKSSEKNKDIIIPGYTHLQRAQLVRLSDYLASYKEMLTRDCDRLKNVEDRIKLSLGAGAFAGTPIKAETYIDALKKHLKDNKEFANAWGMEPVPTVARSMDTVSDRDFVIETLSALAILGMHLSRLAEDLIIWSSKEFGFVEIDDEYATGSSLMPQKKNPDVLELVRGYTGTLYGNLVSVLTMMKGLPLTYNRDMQLDKPPLFNSFEVIQGELAVLPGLIETLEWKKKFIDKQIKDDVALYATDFVYYLIKQKQIPFKVAHDIIGKVVKACIEAGGIGEISDKKLKQIDNRLDKKELIKLMDPEKSVKSRISIDRSEK